MTRRRRLFIPPRSEFPKDIPARLERLKEASGLSWREIAQRLGTDPKTVRRWRQGVLPGTRHLYGLIVLAREAIHDEDFLP